MIKIEAGQVFAILKTGIDCKFTQGSLVQFTGKEWRGLIRVRQIAVGGREEREWMHPSQLAVAGKYCLYQTHGGKYPTWMEAVDCIHQGATEYGKPEYTHCVFCGREITFTAVNTEYREPAQVESQVDMFSEVLS